MSVGNQATSAAINASLTALAVQLRDLCGQIRNFQTYVTTLGTTGLEGAGYTAPDAASVQAMASYLNTIAGVYFGTASQASDFNFDNALSGTWGGQ